MMNNINSLLIFNEKTNMGRLIKNILGKASGKVGDIVFRIVDGKVIIASHVGTNKISKSPSCINNRKRFSSVLNFASAVNKIHDLKIIWNKSRKNIKSGYNKIISENINKLDNNLISKSNMITPGGFDLTNVNAELYKKFGIVRFSTSQSLKRYSESVYNACFVLTCLSPVRKTYKASLSVSNYVPDITVKENSETEIEFRIKGSSSLYDNYNKAVLFFSLTNTKHRNPLCSETYSFEFDLRKDRNK